MDFNPYELYAQTYTQKYSHLNTENLKKYSGGTMTSLQHLTVLFCFETTENLRILAKYKRFWV